jgi:hypothetical protein
MAGSTIGFMDATAQNKKPREYISLRKAVYRTIKLVVNYGIYLQE